jgi:hypothetical protein
MLKSGGVLAANQHLHQPLQRLLRVPAAHPA